MVDTQRLNRAVKTGQVGACLDVGRDNMIAEHENCYVQNWPLIDSLLLQYHNYRIHCKTNTQHTQNKHARNRCR